MIKLDNFSALLANLELRKERPFLIGIDGRPCSGKSMLAEKLTKALSAESLFLDHFFIPQSEWPNSITPSFPFPYFRYQELVNGVHLLAEGMIFKYQPYEWETKKIGRARIIDPNNIIIIKGVSILCEQLAPFFRKKILVVSDQSNELEAISLRENKNLHLLAD